MKAIGSLLGILVAALIICAGPAVYVFDRDVNARPLINIHFFWMKVVWPISPAAQNASLLRSYNTCHASVGTLEGANALQNASLAAVSAAGSRAKADAALAVQRSQAGLAAALKARAAISAPLVADEACARAKEVDGRFMETLR